MASVAARAGNDLRIERVTLDRLDAVIDFLVAEFARESGMPVTSGREADRARWRWSLSEHPAARNGALPSWVCLDGDRIVGHVGAFPSDIAVRGEPRTMAWARDLIVAPAVRGRGAGSALMRTVTEAHGRSGVLGYADTYDLYRRIGYVDMGAVPLFMKVIRPAAFARAFAPRRGLREAVSVAIPLLQLRPPRPRPTLRIDRTTAFDDEFDHWWRGIELDIGCVIRRTSASMEWRYLRRPSHPHRVLAARDTGGLRGLVVVRAGTSRGLPIGIVSEVVARPGDTDAMLELIAAGERDLADAPGGDGIAFIRANVLHKAFGRAFLRSGYLPAPSPIRWILAGAGEAARLDGLRDPSLWYLNGGDSDVDLL